MLRNNSGVKQYKTVIKITTMHFMISSCVLEGRIINVDKEKIAMALGVIEISIDF